MEHVLQGLPLIDPITILWSSSPDVSLMLWLPLDPLPGQPTVIPAGFGEQPLLATTSLSTDTVSSTSVLLNQKTTPSDFESVSSAMAYHFVDLAPFIFQTSSV
jgi:hypothetical protein